MSPKRTLTRGALSRFILPDLLLPSIYTQVGRYRFSLGTFECQ